MVCNMRELAFSDLRVQYGTGRAYTVSGTGRNRVTGYRTGKKCLAGDIETSEWCLLVKDAIKTCGEQVLHKNLFTYLKENNHCFRSKLDLEEYALELHASRIFDNEAWVSFVAFNQQYRPEAINPHHLKWIETECCRKPGQVTQTMINRYSGMVFCPICGRLSAYTFIDPEPRQ